MASVSDKITKVKDGSNPNVARVVTPRPANSDTLSVDSLTGWTEDTAVHFMTYRVDSTGKVVPGSQRDWKGMANKATGQIISLQIQNNAIDDGNLVGDIVQAGPTAAWAQDLAEAMLESHNSDGSLKRGAVGADNIAKDSIVAESIKEKSITADKIDFTTIPMFSATTSKWEVLPQNQHTIVKYDSVVYDTAKMYDTKTFTAKVPKDGVYHIDARTGIAQTGFFSGYTEYITIFKNGTMIKESNRTRGTDNDRHLPRPSLSVDLLLKKNDEINIRAFCSDQRNYGGDSTISEFSMRLVGII
jgi:C1q domain